MEIDSRGTETDWAGLPEPVLLEIATCYLSLSDIKAASQTCQRWSSVLSLCCRKVVLLPAVHGGGPRLSPAECYPPHLFCRSDTVCMLPLSQLLVSATDSLDLETFATVLSAYRLPLLHVQHILPAALAQRTREEGAQRALETARRALQIAAAQAAAGSTPRRRQQLAAAAEPRPQQPYYDLSAPLVTTLTALLRAPQQPGLHLRRLALRLSAMPAPEALGALAALPSLQVLQLLGGPAAFLEGAHLEALEALQGLTELVVEGNWQEVRRPRSRWGQLAVMPHQGGAVGVMNGGVNGGWAAMPGPPDPWAAGDDMEEDMEDLAAAAPPFPVPGGGGGEGGGGAGAAAGANADGDGDGRAPWPGLFASLERLRVLGLRAFASSRRRAGADGGGFFGPAHQFQAAQRLLLDLYPLAGLQALSVYGWQLDLGLSRLGPELLGGITRLEADRVLSVEEWAAVHAMDGLTEASLRAEVAGRMAQPMLSGGNVHVAYGMDGHPGVARGKLSFPLPSKLRQERPLGGAGGAGCSGGGGGGAAAGPPGLPAGPGAVPLGNMFAATVDLSDRQWAQMVRQRMWELGELHVQLEPLRFLSDNTSLTRLDLRWRSAQTASSDHHHNAVDGDGDGEDDGHGGAVHGLVVQPPPPPPRQYRIDDALLARRAYVRCLAALSELQDVELCCPGGEFVLDVALLEALAPAWRGLRRLVYTGVVVGSVDAALALFPRLQELGLHDQPAVGGSSSGAGAGAGAGAAGALDPHQQQQRRRDKLLLRTDRLPAGLQRLLLSQANVLHVPGAGVRGLQRLDLRTGCRWQGGPPPASPTQGPGPGYGQAAGPEAASPGSMSAGFRPAPGPWMLYGMPQLTHLQLAAAPMGAAELRAVVRSVGGQLRRLSLSVPPDPVQAASLIAVLAESVPRLTKLAHLALTLREPSVIVTATATATVAGHGPGLGPDPGPGSGLHSRPPHTRTVLHSSALAPIRGLVEALLGQGQGGPAASGPSRVPGGAGVSGRGPPRLQELRLGLPWCGLSAALAPLLRDQHLLANHDHMNQVQGMQAPMVHGQEGMAPEREKLRQSNLQQLGAALVWALGGLVQLTQLKELRLCGPLVALQREHLERWLLGALPCCHVDLRAAS